MTPHAWRRVALAALLGGIAAGAAPRDAGHGDMPPNMERYSLVLLKRPLSPATVADPEALQQKHLAHLSAMHKAGKLVVAGPFGDQPDPRLRGLCLYRTSLAEAKALAEQDPAVKAGRLEVEVLSWWVQKGAMAFPTPDPVGPSKP
jgi:uncharacterized protein